MNEQRFCPFCGEYINIYAKKCRFCHEWLEDSATDSTPTQLQQPVQQAQNQQAQQQSFHIPTPPTPPVPPQHQAPQPPVMPTPPTQHTPQQIDQESTAQYIETPIPTPEPPKPEPQEYETQQIEPIIPQEATADYGYDEYELDEKRRNRRQHIVVILALFAIISCFLIFCDSSKPTFAAESASAFEETEPATPEEDYTESINEDVIGQWYYNEKDEDDTTTTTFYKLNNDGTFEQEIRNAEKGLTINLTGVFQTSDDVIAFIYDIDSITLFGVDDEDEHDQSISELQDLYREWNKESRGYNFKRSGESLIFIGEDETEIIFTPLI